MIGPEGENGSESFDFNVCTPKWLQQKLPPEEALFGRHKLIVLDYNRDRIIRKINHLCDRTLGSNWTEIATRLARYGHWEFEDYQPHPFKK